MSGDFLHAENAEADPEFTDADGVQTSVTKRSDPSAKVRAS